MSEKAKRYHISGKRRSQIYSKTGGKCFYCGADLPIENILDEGGKVVVVRHFWCIDHQAPISRGGDNGWENLVPACITCNSDKGTMTAVEFLEVLEKRGHEQKVF